MVCSAEEASSTSAKRAAVAAALLAHSSAVALTLDSVATSSAISLSFSVTDAVFSLTDSSSSVQLLHSLCKLCRNSSLACSDSRNFSSTSCKDSFAHRKSVSCCCTNSAEEDILLSRCSRASTSNFFNFDSRSCVADNSVAEVDN